jgi:sialate O-acetylesterase
LLFGGCSSFNGPAKDIKLITLFSDNMVLQRDMVLPIWGTADADGIVKVEINDQIKTTTVQENENLLTSVCLPLAGIRAMTGRRNRS